MPVARPILNLVLMPRSLLIAFLAVFGPTAQAQHTTEQSVSGEPRLYIEEVGTGDSVIVVLHGGPGLSHDYLRPEWDRLVSQGRRVVYYDQRGCGRSGDGAPYTWRADVADLRRVIEDVSPDAPVILAGSSWGSSLAMLYVMEHDEDVRSIVLSGTPPWPEPLNAYASELIRRIRESQGTSVESHADAGADSIESHAPARADSINEGLVSIRRVRLDTASALASVPPGDSLIAFRLARAPQLACKDAHTARVPHWDDLPPIESLADITAPTLFVWGRDDRMLTARARQMAERLPSARVHVMEELGHDPWIEAPDRFFEAVEEFLLTTTRP